MLWKWPIRVKFLVGLGLLLLLVVILSYGSLHSTYTYRSLAADLSSRAEEVPKSGELSRRVSALRITLSELRGLQEVNFPNADVLPLRVQVIRDRFRSGLQDVEDALDLYRCQLEHEVKAGSPISDNQCEWATVRRIEQCLARLPAKYRFADWEFDHAQVMRLEEELQSLQDLTAELPNHLYAKMRRLPR